MKIEDVVQIDVSELGCHVHRPQGEAAVLRSARKILKLSDKIDRMEIKRRGRIKEADRKRLDSDILDLSGQRDAELDRMKLHPRQIEKMSLRIKGFVDRVQEADAEIAQIERELGLTATEVLSISRKGARTRRAGKTIDRQTGRSIEEIREAATALTNARKKLRRTEQECRAPREELILIVEDIERRRAHDAGRRSAR